jgi:hypothetical protein
MTNKIFADLMIKHFIEEVNKRRQGKKVRALLLLDAHSSRANSATLEALSAADIDCVTIPAHTSHVLQPLDLTVNGTFKSELTKLYPKSKVRFDLLA